jgi:hypothetical protein
MLNHTALDNWFETNFASLNIFQYGFKYSSIYVLSIIVSNLKQMLQKIVDLLVNSWNKNFEPLQNFFWNIA